MSPDRRRSHKDDFVATLRDEKVAVQFTDAQALLKRHLVHTRDIPNGKDFYSSVRKRNFMTHSN